MDQFEQDIKMFRDFVLTPQEKAILSAAVVSFGRRDIEQDSKEKRKKEKSVALTNFREEVVKNPEIAPYASMLKHTQEENDDNFFTLARDLKERNKKLLILIELFFANPFRRTKHLPGNGSRKHFLKEIADRFGLPEADYGDLISAYKGALNVQMGRLTKMLIAVAVGLVIGAAGGWILAPVVGGALGGAAGLFGAAAVAHGLALLGGGTLVSGGAGMAGGIALVTAMGAATGGLVSVTGAALFTKSGAATVKVDSMKLQMTIAKIIMGDQKDKAKVQEILRRHEEKIKRLGSALEKLMADKETNKEEIKYLESIIATIEKSQRWTARQLA
jgi:hypothetical protein